MECSIQLPVDVGQKIQILSEFSKVYNKYEPFAKWLEDTSVPAESKKPFLESMQNAIKSLQFLKDFMVNCGITDSEILEYTKIPF
jgi:hypothetical protein